MALIKVRTLVIPMGSHGLHLWLRVLKIYMLLVKIIGGKYMLLVKIIGGKIYVIG